jgi:hypothetical protein
LNAATLFPDCASLHPGYASWLGTYSNELYRYKVEEFPSSLRSQGRRRTFRTRPYLPNSPSTSRPGIGNPSGCVSLRTSFRLKSVLTATDREIQMRDFKKRPVIFPVLALLAFVVAGGLPAGAQTLKAVQERGTLNCGVSQGLLGFSSMDDKNAWIGFDVDICRAVAAAIFGDPAKVTFMPLDAAARFAALQSNQIDMLSRNSTWTMSRESSLGLMFAGVAYYDGQGFLLRRDAGIDTALQLAGKTVCAQTGTTSELNVTDISGPTTWR